MARKITKEDVTRFIEHALDRPTGRIRTVRSMAVFPNQCVLADRDGNQFVVTVQKARKPRERKWKP